ncbi:Rieske (2Fe-2S) protein [Desertibacillus haloalkaliphilus]|uniref:Rieske (2Fe-2S) protein n=1 Tax=Desertibacillus haloalkaliphilus TaxID=1328930 RepID=UPI001C27E15B|nr:Rieske 2Fe-2S domain-containing protein [Desertibacillus haloalkaliphilus]MBU8906242.1 Rieske 2Fe-2S domain-containing protein [Desertibacillus haloalkaliphilus]
MERNVLCKKSEIPLGESKVFQVRRLSVVVVRKENEQFYAVRNFCPHQGAELGKGVLRGAARANDVKDVCYEKPGSFLYCPWHHWSFDVENGCSMHDPENTKIKTYDVKVENDEVVLYA